ncbi:MAG: hypothetical protein RSD14_05165 [Clostridia bacterium]
MKVKYIGETFGALSLTNNKIYECIEVDELTDMLRIIDDSEEDYLYSAINLKSLTEAIKCGIWEIIEDDENNTLAKLFERIKL